MTKQEMKTLKMNLLGGMHEYIRHLNDENAYEEWIVDGVPDCPSEDDLEYIAEHDTSFADCCRLFGSIVKQYINDGECLD